MSNKKRPNRNVKPPYSDDPGGDLDRLLHNFRLELAWQRSWDEKDALDRERGYVSYELTEAKDGSTALRLRTELCGVDHRISTLEKKVSVLELELRAAKLNLKEQYLEHCNLLSRYYASPLSKVSRLVEMEHGGRCSCNVRVPTKAYYDIKSRAVVICERCSRFILSEADFKTL